MTTAISSLLFFLISPSLFNSVCKNNCEVATENLESRNWVIKEYYRYVQFSPLDTRGEIKNITLKN